MPSLVRLASTASVALTIVAGLASPANASPAPPAHRIVSLVPSLTEDLFAMGAGGQIVGVSTYADFPAAAKRLPVVATLTSVDAERVVALHPDLVVGIPRQAAQVELLRRAGLRTVLLVDDSYADLFANIQTLGILSGHRADSNVLVQRLITQTAAMTIHIRGAGRHPRCLVVLGVDPTYTVGDASYIASLIRLAGGQNAARLKTAYGRYDEEAILAARPDVLIAERSGRLAGVLDRPPWNALPAVRNHHVEPLDDPAILERPSPRYVQGLRWLIAHLKGA